MQTRHRMNASRTRASRPRGGYFRCGTLVRPSLTRLALQCNATVLVFACLACGRLPGSAIGHWTFDREDASILVDDDQEERLRGFVFVHGLRESVPCYRLHGFITLGRPFPQRRVRCQP